MHLPAVPPSAGPGPPWPLTPPWYQDPMVSHAAPWQQETRRRIVRVSLSSLLFSLPLAPAAPWQQETLSLIGSWTLSLSLSLSLIGSWVHRPRLPGPSSVPERLSHQCQGSLMRERPSSVTPGPSSVTPGSIVRVSLVPHQ